MSKHFQGLLDALHVFDQYWKEKSDFIYEKKLSLTDPLITRINHIRQSIRFYMFPALEHLTQASEFEQQLVLQYLPVLQDKASTLRLLQHFYALVREEDGEWAFLDQTPYDQDVFVLYDLFKTKKNIELATELLQEVQQGVLFQSQFSTDEQIKILKGVRAAMVMTFKHTLRPEVLDTIYQGLSLDDLTLQAIEKRKKEQTLYARPDTLEGSPYRRIFLHLLFRKQIKTKVKGKATTIGYDLIQFEQLKREYFTHWMTELEDAAKLDVYQQFQLDKKTFAEWIVENPEGESHALMEMPQEQFESLVYETYEKVPEEKKPKVHPLSESLGVLGKANQQFNQFLDQLKHQFQVSTSEDTKSLLGQLTSISKKLPKSFDTKTLPKTNLEQIFSKVTWQPKHQEVNLENHKVANVVVLLRKEFFEHYGQEVKIALKTIPVPIHVTFPEQLALQDVEEASLLLKLRCGLPTQDRDGQLLPEALKCEQIDIDFPLDDYPIPDLNQNLSHATTQKRMTTLIQNIESLSHQKAFQAAYESQVEIWEAEQLIDQYQKQIQKVQMLYAKEISQYQTLLYWLMIEVLEDSGHLATLIKELSRVTRCLIIDDLGIPLEDYFYSLGFTPNNLFFWNRDTFKEKLQDVSGKKNLKANMAALIEDLELQKYELVLMVHWQAARDSVLPIYLSCSKPYAKTYRINAYQIFDANYDFLQHCFEKMKAVQGTAVRLSPQPYLFERLQEVHQKLTPIYLNIDALTDHTSYLNEELQKQAEDLGYHTFETDIKAYLFERVEFFIHCHRIRLFEEHS